MKKTFSKVPKGPPKAERSTLVLTEVWFEPGEVAEIMEAAAMGNQTLQEFMQQATREGLARYRAGGKI